MNQQVQFWQGDFGQQYTDRSIFSPDELNKRYAEAHMGVTREQLNKEFLGDLKIGKILEAGCNVGNQLRLLQHMGFKDLNGIELQWYAVEKAKTLTQNINIMQGNLLDMPFKDGFFDLVYTAGVLIHISPDNIKKAMSEIYRVSNRYIWGTEYYNDEYIEIDYRGNGNALWKGNFMQMYVDQFPELRIVKYKKLPTVSGNVNIMFLLEKQPS